MQKFSEEVFEIKRLLVKFLFLVILDLNNCSCSRSDATFGKFFPCFFFFFAKTFFSSVACLLPLSLLFCARFLLFLASR